MQLLFYFLILSLPLSSLSLAPIHLRRAAASQSSDYWIAERQRLIGKYSSPLSHSLRRRAATESSQSSSYTSATSASTSSGSSTGSSTTSSSASVSSSAIGALSTSVGVQSLVNYQADLQYYAPILVGNPAQEYNVVLDTGSADLWLMSPNCSSGCTSGVPTYNTSASSTAANIEASFSVSYGNGYASGNLYTDNVTLAGHSYSSQGLASVTNVSSGLLSGNVSGILGLGFNSLAASGLNPLWENVLSSSISSNISFSGFTFALSRYINSTEATNVEPGGIFTLGTLHNESYIEPIRYVDVVSSLESYWIIPMDAVYMNTTYKVNNISSTNVVIDTGTTLIGGPPTEVAAFYSMIDGARSAGSSFQGYYVYPCATQVNASLEFGGYLYNISAADFNLGAFGAQSNQECLGAFFELDLDSTTSIAEDSNLNTSSIVTWVVGNAFLKNVYSVFQYSPAAVGFASLNYSDTISYDPAHVSTTSSFIPPTSSPTESKPPSPSSTKELNREGDNINTKSSAAIRLSPPSIWSFQKQVLYPTVHVLLLLTFLGFVCISPL